MNEKLISVSLVTLFSINQVFAADNVVTVELNLGESLRDNKDLNVEYEDKNEEIVISKIEVKDITNKIIELVIPGEINKKQVKLKNNAFKKQDLSAINAPPKMNVKFVKRNEKVVIFPENSSELFANNSDIGSITGEVDTSKVISMYAMFDGCRNLKELNLNSFDTKLVTNMKCMFRGCTNLQNLDLGNFKTQNVQNMDSMFFECQNLQTLDLSSFNTNNVNNMRDMFFACKKLKKINLNNFNTQNVTSKSRMFNMCDNLKTLIVNKKSFNKYILSKLPNEVNIIDIASLAGKRNELNQIYWRIVANNAIIDAEPNGKHSWIRDKEYEESIIKIIGKAIGDCVTEQNEFANPTEDGLIVFKGTEPKDYEPEHWNAVFLYNYIHALMYPKPDAPKTDLDLLKDINNRLIKHYDYLAEQAIQKKINNAILDISEYSEALGLREILKEYKSKRDDYNQNPQKNNLVPHFSVNKGDYGFDKEISIKNDESEESHERFLLINCKNGKLCITPIVPDTSDEFSTSIEDINYNQHETETEAYRDCNYIQKLLDGLAEVSNMS